MRLKYNKYMFSDMDYLDNEIKRYKGKYPNPNTENYYKALTNIKNIQQKGNIPTEADYLEVGKSKYFNSVEYGYYTANIHYDLFRYDESYTTLFKRIVYFFDNADSKVLLDKSGWFTLNFPFDLLTYIETVFDLERVSIYDEKDIIKYLEEVAFKSKDTLTIAVVNKLRVIMDGIKTESDIILKPANLTLIAGRPKVGRKSLVKEKLNKSDALVFYGLRYDTYNLNVAIKRLKDLAETLNKPIIVIYQSNRDTDFDISIDKLKELDLSYIDNLYGMLYGKILLKLR